MSGWEKVIAATLVAIAGLAGVNLAIWRRLRVARAEAHRLPGQVENERQRSVQQRQVEFAEATNHSIDMGAANGT